MGLLLAPGEQGHVLLRDTGWEGSVQTLLVFSLTKYFVKTFSEEICNVFHA